MAEVLNTNVFDANKKFVDFAGLDYFWDKAKAYVDGVDKEMADRIKANEDAIKSINDELDSLSGGAGSIQTQISNAISALDLPNTYDAKGSAAQALVDAKAYADGKVDGKFDAIGAADQALVDAKTYADGLAVNYDAAGSAAAVAGDLDVHVKDTTVHITADERTSWNAAKTAIDAFLKDADMTEKAVDTLAELQTYMEADGAAAAELVGRVAVLEAINHDAYVAADATVLADAKTYADGLAVNYDATGSAAQALTDAKSYVDGKVDGKFDATGSAAQALTDAKAYADGLAVNYDATGSAAQALTDAKAYADGLAVNYDAAGAASAAEAAAIAQAKKDAAEALKSYYTKTEVDAKLAENSTVDKAYAKQYTDELFGSFKFAGTTDIDGLFA